MSTIPGMTHWPVASTTSGQPASSSGVSEISAMRPSTIPRWRTPEGPPVPSKNRPPLMIVSKVTGAIEAAYLTRVKYWSGRGGERLRHDVERLVEQLVGDRQRRQEAHHVAPGAARQGDHALLVAVRRDRAGA